MPSFGYIPHMVSEKKIFKHFYENWPFLPPRRPIKFTDFDKSCMKRRDLLNKHFCKKKFQISPMKQKKLSISSFSHYKSMGTISCHSNQSSYPTGTKKRNYSFPRPIDAICEIWKESASRLQRRCRLKMLTDGRTMDGRRIPLYTISSPMSLLLRWAKNVHITYNRLIKTIRQRSNFFVLLIYRLKNL